MSCDICSFLSQYQRTICETKFWKVDICDNQEYLGRSYITLKRHCPNLSNITTDEWSDFLSLIKKIENAIQKAFGATSFNWTCMMNDTFKKESPQPHVHWHLRPRYAQNVNFAGITFIDPEYGHHYARSSERILILSNDKLLEIINEIKKYL